MVKNMLNRFQYGTIVDLKAMEDITNTGIYVVDKNSGEIRKAKNADEYLTHQIVLVNDNIVSDCNTIYAGERCRCWYMYLVM